MAPASMRPSRRSSMTPSQGNRRRREDAAPTQPEKTQNYTLMSVEDIMDTLGKCGVPVDVADLRVPTPQFVQDIVCAFVANLLAIEGAEAATTVKEAVEEMEQRTATPSVIGQVGGNSLLVFYLRKLCVLPTDQRLRLVRWLTKDTGVDVTARDLFAPTALRTQKVLSAVLSLCLYREVASERYAEALGETDSLDEQCTSANRERERLNEVLGDVQRSWQGAHGKWEQTEADQTQLLSTLQLTSVQCEQLQTRQGELTQQSAELETTVAESQKRLDIMKSGTESLRACIVLSPEQLEAAIESVNTEITKASERMAQLVSSYQSAQQSLGTVQQLGEMVRSIDLKQLSALRDELDQVNVEVECRTHEVLPLQLQKQDLDGQLRVLKEEAGVMERRRDRVAASLRRMTAEPAMMFTSGVDQSMMMMTSMHGGGGAAEVLNSQSVLIGAGMGHLAEESMLVDDDGGLTTGRGMAQGLQAEQETVISNLGIQNESLEAAQADVAQVTARLADQRRQHSLRVQTALCRAAETRGLLSRYNVSIRDALATTASVVGVGE